MSEALSSKLCAPGQQISLEVMYAATVAETRTGQDPEGGKISFKRVSDDCAG